MKGLEQDHRDMAKIAKIDMNRVRLMGDKKAAITIVKEWDCVRATKKMSGTRLLHMLHCTSLSSQTT